MGLFVALPVIQTTVSLYQRAGVKVGRPGTRRYGVPADAISVPADSASEIVKFTISIPRESCTNAKAKYSSSVVPPDPSVHFYHWHTHTHTHRHTHTCAVYCANIAETRCLIAAQLFIIATRLRVDPFSAGMIYTDKYIFAAAATAAASFGAL